MLKRFCVGFAALCLGAIGFGSLLGGFFCAVCLGFAVPVPITVIELLLALAASTVAAVLLKPIIDAYPGGVTISANKSSITVGLRKD